MKSTNQKLIEGMYYRCESKADYVYVFQFKGTDQNRIASSKYIYRNVTDNNQGLSVIDCEYLIDGREEIITSATAGEIRWLEDSFKARRYLDYELFKDIEYEIY